jgi:hypothetical protein
MGFVIARALMDFRASSSPYRFSGPSKGLGNSQVWKTPVLTGSPSTLRDHLRNLRQVIKFFFSRKAADACPSAPIRGDGPSFVEIGIW